MPLAQAHINNASSPLRMHRTTSSRHLPAAEVNDLVESHIRGDAPRGSIGEERVDVLELNLALDQLTG